MLNIEKYISEKDYPEALSECLRTHQNYLGLLLSKVLKDSSLKNFEKQFETNIEGMEKEGTILDNVTDIINENPDLGVDESKNEVTTVRLLCNWASSQKLREDWNKMSQGNYRWNNIKIVCDDNADYTVVVNCPPISTFPNPENTIVFRMEPYMEKRPEMWGEWSKPSPKHFFRVCYHKDDYNNNEWHLGKTYQELKTMKIEKTEDKMSTVLSAKYKDPGHIKRIDFVKFLEKKEFPVHVYGDNKFEYKDYKGTLPPGCKDDAMFPYKYVFNVENSSIKNYYTEKVIDGILSECLVFYSGCYNLKDFIDERAFVYLELSNFEDDYLKVKNAMENNLWEERLPYIRAAKKKILEYLQFFPRLERIINKNEDQIWEVNDTSLV